MKKIASLGIIGFLVLSCAAKPEVYQETDTSLYRGNFESGIETIRRAQESKKPMYPNSNVVAMYLDRGMLHHYAGNYAASSRDLQEAERLIEEAYTKSISAGIASYIANDNTKDYAGEDFENIYINVFNALNYYNQGNTEGALVEIRKLILSSGKLDMLSRRYEEGNKGAGDWVLEQLAKIGFTMDASLPQGEPMNYSGSALAQYLGGLFFLASGNEDSARIAFNAVQEAFAANPKIYDHPLPKAVEDARNVPRGMARLNIVAFAGLSPIKEEKQFAQNWVFMQNAELRQPVFKLPVFIDRDMGDHQISVSVNGQTFELELIEDMGTVAKETYNAKFANLFFKTWIRVLLKYAAADIAATQAGKTQGGNLARLAAANAARAAVNASESADIRMGRYMPNKAYVGGINLEPGSYPVTITFSSGYVKNMIVDVKAGGINLYDVVNLTPPNAPRGQRDSHPAPPAAAVAGAAPPDRRGAAADGSPPAGRPASQAAAESEPPAASQGTPAASEAPSQNIAELEARIAALEQIEEERQREKERNAWRNKWVYLGGAIGGGAYFYDYWYEDNHTYPIYDTNWPYDYRGTAIDYYGGYYEYDSGPVFAFGAVADFALLRFFSVEVILGLWAGGDTAYPIMPFLGKIGGRDGQVELFFNGGYTVGLGATFGGTFGVHAGPGIVFLEYLIAPFPDIGRYEEDRLNSVWFMLLGYKVGFGDKR